WTRTSCACSSSSESASTARRNFPIGREVMGTAGPWTRSGVDWKIHQKGPAKVMTFGDPRSAVGGGVHPLLPMCGRRTVERREPHPFRATTEFTLHRPHEGVLDLVIAWPAAGLAGMSR